MDFNLTEDRRMLSDTLTRYLAEQYPVEHRNKVAYDAVPRSCLFCSCVAAIH